MMILDKSDSSCFIFTAEMFRPASLSGCGKESVMFSPAVNLNCCALFSLSVTVKSSEDAAFITPEESFLPLPAHEVSDTEG